MASLPFDAVGPAVPAIVDLNDAAACAVAIVDTAPMGDRIKIKRPPSL
jgi:hypothetical protein